MDGQGIDQFGIGQPVRRKEDHRLVTGTGRFTDDIDLDGQAYGHVVRSTHAHAKILSIDTAAAARAPGVLGVFTIADLDADGVAELPVQARPVLARGVVRFVGNPVAFVVAETLEQARDAGELVEIAYEALPAVTNARDADAPDAPLLYPERGSNLCVHWQSHDGKAV
jgi:carbon-monoxide dehydrogenase large subunit